MKILVISMMLVFGHFAMASNNIPANQAEGHYTCYGSDNGVYLELGVLIQTNDGKTTVTWFRQEAEDTLPYSRVSFKYDNGKYNLTMSKIKFNCSRDW